MAGNPARGHPDGGGQGIPEHRHPGVEAPLRGGSQRHDGAVLTNMGNPTPSFMDVEEHHSGLQFVMVTETIPERVDAAASPRSRRKGPPAIWRRILGLFGN